MSSAHELAALVDAGRRAGDRWLWRGLTLRLAPGDRVAVTGPSGSGKTLLLRALAGLDALDEGVLRGNGDVVAERALPQHRARVLYLAQHAALLADTVAADLDRAFALRCRDGARRDEQRTGELLAALDLDADFTQRSTERLSGGERQVVALVRALLVEPRVLLLDEATASMDAQRTKAAEQLVLDWLAAGERALVWVSHDDSQSARMGARQLSLGGDTEAAS